MGENPTVFVVDDDAAIRTAVGAVCQSLRIPVEGYESGESFLNSYTEPRPGCLIIDLKMPGIDGIELHERLLEAGHQLPVIMISGHGDVNSAVRSLQNGAITFLEKPFNMLELTTHIREALQRISDVFQNAREQSLAEQRLDSLSSKEVAVLERLLDGNTNKEIARKLNVSVRTIEDRRSNIMRKLRVESLPEVIKVISTALGQSPTLDSYFAEPISL